MCQLSFTKKVIVTDQKDKKVLRSE